MPQHDRDHGMVPLECDRGAALGRRLYIRLSCMNDTSLVASQGRRNWRNTTLEVSMNPTVVVDWLLRSERGREALKEALLFLPKELEVQFLERYRPAYVLVKAYRDGGVEVFGEKFVRPKVLFMGRQTTCPEAEVVAQSNADQLLPDRFKEINFPGCLVESACRNDLTIADQEVTVMPPAERQARWDRNRALDKVNRWYYGEEVRERGLVSATGA